MHEALGFIPRTTHTNERKTKKERKRTNERKRTKKEKENAKIN
jgi:hypothetical protein